MYNMLLSPSWQLRNLFFPFQCYCPGFQGADKKDLLFWSGIIPHQERKKQRQTREILHLSVFIYSGVPVITLNQNSTTASLQPSSLCLLAIDASPRPQPPPTASPHGQDLLSPGQPRLSENSAYSSQQVLSACQGPETTGSSLPALVPAVLRPSR